MKNDEILSSTLRSNICIKGYGFLSFSINMCENIGKNINKNLNE